MWAAWVSEDRRFTVPFQHFCLNVLQPQRSEALRRHSRLVATRSGMDCGRVQPPALRRAAYDCLSIIETERQEWLVPRLRQRFSPRHMMRRGKYLKEKGRLPDAQKTLASQYGIAERTASGYIGCFLAMRRGSTFKTIVSADGLRFMLNRIAEGGHGDLIIALQSVMSHVMYLQNITGNEPGLRRVHAEFVGRLRELAEFDEVSLSLDVEVTKALADTQEARAKRLKQAWAMPEQQIVLRRVFRRNPDVIAEVLLLAEWRVSTLRSRRTFPAHGRSSVSRSASSSAACRGR